MAHEVPLERLRKDYDLKALGFASTDEVQPSSGILGQEPALRALRFGLSSQSDGFNVYVAGEPGTGRTTAVMAYLQDVAKGKPVPGDWCYINNFVDPYRPSALHLPPGQARQFSRDMNELVQEMRKRIPLLYEGTLYTQRRMAITSAFDEQRQQLFDGLARSAKKAGFRVEASDSGLTLVPLKDKRPMTEEDMAALSDAERQELLARREVVDGQVSTATKQVRQAEKLVRRQLEALDKDIAAGAIRPAIEELKAKYGVSTGAQVYLDAVQGDMLANLAAFRAEEREREEAPAESSQPSFGFSRYAVNIVVDNSDWNGAPVVTESNPMFGNLLGRIEREAEFGALITDFTMLKGGSLHRANGGYLIMPAEELVAAPGAWDGLKRALRNRNVVIEDAAERMAAVPVKGVQPEPIPLNVKVILIGDPRSHYALYSGDPDFRELFKVKADFDVRMEASAQHVADYVGFMHALCDKENLRHLQREAAARIVEHASRLAEDQEQLSTHFGAIADVLREANYWAGEDGVQTVAAAHVRQALEARISRSDLFQRQVKQQIAEGTVVIDTTGKVAGQVNGLYVVNVGDYRFGCPRRITASVGMGKKGVADIEYQVRLAGPLHAKGGLILTGYLNGRYAQDKPISLSASIVFEQSYEEIEGDSASCAELCALLSALVDLPVSQGLAMTGSVDQRGGVQAIGAVNEKIEGFFDVCRDRGLTGKQGVIIPHSNVRNLMLRKDVIGAVRDGQFTVFAIRHVDEGLELLTGVSAGVRGPDGKFPTGSVNARVDARLQELAEGLYKFGEQEGRD